MIKKYKKSEGYPVAQEVMAGWPDTTLMGKRPYQICEAFGVTITEAEELLKSERKKRNM